MSGEQPIEPIEARFRGPKGEKGEKGEAGLPVRIRRAIVVLFALPSLIAVVAVIGVVVQTHHYQSSHARTEAALYRTERVQTRTERTQAGTVRKLDRTVRRLTREVRSQCRFDGDLAGVPIALNPATRKASVLSVKIVSDSRVAWRQAGCPGRIARPSPSFARWARRYHLPAG